MSTGTNPPGLRAGPWYPLLHLPLIIAGWLLFAWLWWLVFRRSWQSSGLQNLVAGAAIMLPTITLLWIAHNRNIYRRLGPRRNLRMVPMVYDADFFGRRIDADWPLLQQARMVTIVIDADGKHYRPQPEPSRLP